MINLSKFIIIFFFISLDINSEAINLLYKNKYIKIKNILQSSIPINNKETYNPYIFGNGSKDSRFLNYNYRENGIDISKKILFLKKGSSIEFLIEKTLNHKIYYQVKENQKVELFLNEKIIQKDNLISNYKENNLKIYAETDVVISNLYLSPLEVTNIAKDLIFIVIDSLRGDVPGFNGGGFLSTPHLDEFSKETYIFQKHLVNSSWTRPSTLIFFTGLYPSKSFINFWDYPVFKNEKDAFYSSSIKSLPVVLAENGYRTILIGNNPFFTDHRYIGLDIGFEEVYEFSFLDKDTPLITSKFHKFWDNKNIDKRPIFLFLNYNDPHKPYEPPYEFRQKVKAPINTDGRKIDYLGEVAYVDSEISTILKKIKLSSNYENTMILVTSDHGEVMNPYHAKSKFTDVYTLFGHGQGLYEEDIHTPLLIKIPEKQISKKINLVSRSIDLYPTILDYLSIELKNPIDGISLRSIIEGEETQDRDYYGESRGVKGVRKNGFKFMKKTFEFHREGPAWDGKVGKEESYLFNLKEDPNEIQPILNKNIENELIKDFSKGNQSKNLYFVRINNKNSKKKDIKLTLQIPYGSIKNEDSKEVNYLERYFTENIVINEGETIEKSFSIYPDVLIPNISVLIENRNPLKGEFGVGELDLFPKNCSITNLDCIDLFTSSQKGPKSVNKFRVQIWVSQAGKKLSNEKVLLEKEAIDILKRQGYIQ
jgi:arylsulfatase A-like enzyme